jgi:hypothetical protein
MINSLIDGLIAGPRLIAEAADERETARHRDRMFV